MAAKAPARVGMDVADVDTPALLLDLGAYERNLNRMQGFADAARVRLRPHAKTHKCAIIARQQISLGAVGVCCQKVSEAESMVHAGVGDVLVSNEIVGETKLLRLAALAKLARIGVCVDALANVEDLNRAAQTFDVQLDVLVEIDVGSRRCGVVALDDAVKLVKTVLAAPQLRFGGIQAYSGATQHVRNYTERRTSAEAAAAKAAALRDHLRDSGIDCEVVSGAGTGTYRFDAASGIYNELQCGSYLFMDADYRRNRDQSGAQISDFENSLFILTTVMSKTRPDLAVVDAGLKSVSVDSGLPLVFGHPQVRYVDASDEHGRLDTTDAGVTIAYGDKLRLVPGHCDPTVNLYDWYVGYRGERVEQVWPIVARGAVT